MCIPTFTTRRKLQCQVAATRRSDARAWSRRPNVYTAQLVVGERRGSSEMRTPLVVGRARVRGPCARRMELDRMDTHFFKLVHVAKIGTKPCELESHRLRTNSSHMQPCFSGSLPGCTGRAPVARARTCSTCPLAQCGALAHAHLCTTSPICARPQRLACELTHAPCVQLIHDARVRHRMRSSFGTVVTVSRRHTKHTSSCLPGCLRLNCSPASSKNSVLVVW